MLVLVFPASISVRREAFMTRVEDNLATAFTGIKKDRARCRVMELQRNLSLPASLQRRSDADQPAARVSALSKNLTGHVVRHADRFNRTAQEKAMRRNDEMLTRFTAPMLCHAFIEVLGIDRDELAIVSHSRLENSNFVIGPKVVAVAGCAVADDFFIIDGSDLAGLERLDETLTGAVEDIRVTQNARRATEPTVERLPVVCGLVERLSLRVHGDVSLCELMKKKKGLLPFLFMGFV